MAGTLGDTLIHLIRDTLVAECLVIFADWTHKCIDGITLVLLDGTKFYETLLASPIATLVAPPLSVNAQGPFLFYKQLVSST